MGAQMASLQDVANKTGFSKSTVSRALRDAPNISPKTKQLIAKAARELNYQPNPVARAMSYGEIKIILIVAPSVDEPFQAEVIQGCREQLYRHGYNTLVLDSSLFNQRSNTYVDVVAQQICNGTVFMYENTDEVMRCIAGRQPVISLELATDTTNISYVVTNEDQCMKEVLSTLYHSYGHRRIALVNGRPNEPFTCRYGRAFKAYTEKLGLELPASYVVEDNWGKQGGRDGIHILLQNKLPPTAILFTTTSLASGGLLGAHEMGVSIPESLSIVSLDGALACQYLVPGIATVDYDLRKIGENLADTLYSQITGKATERQTITVSPGRIRKGGSLGYAK